MRSEATPTDSRPPPDTRRVPGPSLRGQGTPAGDLEGAGYPVDSNTDVDTDADVDVDASAALSMEKAGHIIIADRLKRAGESVYARGRPDHPCFKSAGIAAANLLRLIPPGSPVLVMRDQCLRPLRELVLEQDRGLVVPSDTGMNVVRIPRSVLFDAEGTRIAKALLIDPLPKGCRSYVGPVGVVVVGCLAFNPSFRRLYSFDNCRTAADLDEMYSGLKSGFVLPARVPVVALAADCQEVTDWPLAPLGAAEVDFVVTPLRCFVLGTGEVVPLSPSGSAGGANPILTHGRSVPLGGLDYVQPQHQ